MNIRKLQSALVAIPVLLFACKKDKPVEIKTPEINSTKGIYVLCEGSFITPNSSAITYYDIATNTTEANFYKKVNGTDLGSNANDLKAYGSKMYCVVTGTGADNTSFVDVISIATGKSLKRIAFNNAEPRSVAFANGKAYVSNYNGKISRIDTASMSIDSELQLVNGSNNAGALEQLDVANGKLYVANSIRSDFPTSLNTKVTVIDLATFKKLRDIEVGPNPTKVVSALNGDVYVVTWTDYSGLYNPPTLVRINSSTDVVTQTESYDLGAISIGRKSAWVTKDLYSLTSTPSVKNLNVATGKVGTDLIADGTNLSSFYGLTINEFDNTVLVTDLSSQAYLFTADGKKKYNFSTGTNPQSAVFNYTYK